MAGVEEHATAGSESAGEASKSRAGATEETQHLCYFPEKPSTVPQHAILPWTS